MHVNIRSTSKFCHQASDWNHKVAKFCISEFQGSRIEKHTREQREQMRRIFLTNETWWTGEICSSDVINHAESHCFGPCNRYTNEHRPIRLTQCCTQFRSLGVTILCALYLHYKVTFTFKWYGNSWNKKFYSQRVWIGYNIELAELVFCQGISSVKWCDANYIFSWIPFFVCDDSRWNGS